MNRRTSLGLAFLLAVSTVIVGAGPALAAGDINGNVTDDLSGDPIQGICVEAHDAASEGTVLGFDTTDVNGDYTIAALADGAYKLFFYDPGTCGSQIEAGTPVWTGEWWNNQADHASAGTVTIAGANVTRNAGLEGTGIVDGTPNDGTNDIDCVRVFLYDQDTMTLLASENTAGDAMYEFTGLITGVNYTLRFESSGTNECTGLAGEWHGGLPVEPGTARFGDQADNFTVGAGATVTIDPTLQPPVTITGTMVSERTGLPVVGATVRLYPNGAVTNSADWIEVDTDGSGVFTFDDSTELVTDNIYGYFLQAELYTDAEGLLWDLEWWNDAEIITSAANISTNGLTGTTVDLSATGDLDRHGPGSINGTVTEDGSGDPIAGVTVSLFADGGTTVLATDVTAADGTYDLGDMNPAEYDVQFVASGYTTEWNSDDTDASAGSTTVLMSDEDDLLATTLNAALSAADDASISGTVTDEDTGLPIEDAMVSLYTAAGGFVNYYYTDENGDYTFPDLSPAEYDLEFSAFLYVTEWYDDVASAAAGSVTVNASENVIADAELKSNASSISGTITAQSNLAGGDFSMVTVEVYLDGAFYSSEPANANGTYTVGELPPGNYTVLASTGPAESPDTYFQAWYVFSPLFVTGDADDVILASDQDLGGIDIELQPLFTDVPGSHLFYDDIVWMQQMGITLGCGGGEYCASDLVTRAQMATFLVRALGLPVDNTDYFGDDDGNVHEANINALRGAEITFGCTPDGLSFCPDDTVTRAQMATFIVRGMEYAISLTDYFIDDDGNVHEDNINTLRENNVTFGCTPDGLSFCPNDPVRRDHMAAFIHRALDP